MAPRRHGYGLSTALFLRLIKKPVLRGGSARRHAGVPALLMPDQDWAPAASGRCCRLRASHAQGCGLLGGILGLQRKGPTPGEGLRRVGLAPWSLVHLPWTCWRWFSSRDGFSLPPVRAAWWDADSGRWDADGGSWTWGITGHHPSHPTLPSSPGDPPADRVLPDREWEQGGVSQVMWEIT